MGFNIAVESNVVIPEASNNAFAPLPAGPYEVTVFDVEQKVYGDKSGNAGRPNVNVQFRISDGQKGANRRVFQTVGLFPTWAPTDKNPGGADNFTFFQFFAAVQGKSEKDFRIEVRESVTAGKGIDLPDLTSLLGKPLVIVLSVKPDVYAFKRAESEGTLEAGQTQEDFKRNEIASFRVAGTAGTSSAASGTAGSAKPAGEFITL